MLVHLAKQVRRMTPRVAVTQLEVRSKPLNVGVGRAILTTTTHGQDLRIAVVGGPAIQKEVAEVSVSPVTATPPAPPAPTVFKTIGYVEKAAGQLEAIILQENQVQVVHIGDRIAGRYRVTKITPDLVDALDETLAQSSMAKSGRAESEVLTVMGTEPPPTALPAAAPAQPEVLEVATEMTQPQKTQGVEPEASSLGYVQHADGKVIAVVADGESIRLVPATPTDAMAIVTPSGALPGAASPTLGPTPPGAAIALATGAVTAPAAQSGGLSETLTVQQASFQVPLPGAKGLAPNGFSMISVGRAAGVLNPASSPPNATSAARLSGSTDRVAKLPVDLKPLGFVVKADGEFAAVLSQDDDVYIVHPGDHFAGHYRALSVSPDVVEAVEEPPRQALPPSFASPSAFPDLLSASAQRGPSRYWNEDCSGCKFKEPGEESASVPKDPPRDVASSPPRRGTGVLPVSNHSQQGPATFIFQTLGTVETQDGQVQAIVADGSQVYLVKQGETFADQYRATSVDPILVLAVRVSPGALVGNSLSARTESGGRSASKNLYGYLHTPLSGMANVQTFAEVDASGIPVFGDLSVNLFNSSSTGFNF